jgi:hypothetical protein
MKATPSAVTRAIVTAQAVRDGHRAAASNAALRRELTGRGAIGWPRRGAADVDLVVSGLKSDSPPGGPESLPPRRQAAVRGRRRLEEAGSRPSRRTLDLLQACRMTSVRTNENRPANRAFSLKPPTIGGPRVRNQSDRMQRNKATAATKKACKCRPFSKRLKGFEPSTFCMASRTPASRPELNGPANEPFSAPPRRAANPGIYREITGVSGPKPDRAWHSELGIGERGG